MKISELRNKNNQITKERIDKITSNWVLVWTKKYKLKLKIKKQDKNFIIPKLSKSELEYLNNKYKKILLENNFSSIQDMLNKWYVFYL